MTDQALFDFGSMKRELTLRIRRIHEAGLRPSLALDLGSENSRIAIAGLHSPPVMIPSRLAIDLKTESIVAVGCTALRMVERVPSGMRIESPIQAGVIAQPGLAETLIRHLLRQSMGPRRIMRPDLVIAAPANATSVQLRALAAVASEAGARNVTLIHEGIAAALGADLPVRSAMGSLIVEIGAEKTEIVVAAFGGVVVSTTAAVGGAQVSDAIARYLRHAHQLMIGRPSADAIKHEIGCAMPSNESIVTNARGRDQLRGLPARVELKANELVEPIQEVLDAIVSAIHLVLEKTPPELCADIASTGIHLSGGGSLLKGLAPFLERTLHLPTHVVADPFTSVVRGCQRSATDRALLRDVAHLK